MKILESIFPFPGFNIKNISAKEDSQTIRIFLEKKEDTAFCYVCGNQLASIRAHRKCLVEDMQIFEKKALVSFRRRKGKCPNCKCYRMEYIDWLSPENPKITMRAGIFLFKLCEVAPVSRIAGIMKKAKMSLWRNDLAYLKAQLERYKIPDLSDISVDEVYARAWHDPENENRNDRFFTIISDLKSHRVVWVEESRRKEALDRFFKLLGKDRCEKIKVVATDQHDDYTASIAEHCPNATQVYDRFHLVKKFEEAINDTRNRLYKMLPQKEVKALARPKYRFIFLKSAEKRTLSEQEHMAKVMKDNQAFINLEMIKERWITFFDAEGPTDALAIFNEIGVMISAAGFPEMKDWWRKTMAHWKTICNYFTYRVTTSLSEGINNVIKAIKRRAYGFRNMEYFRLKIMQVCGFLSTDYLNFDGTWTLKAKAALGITKSLEMQPNR